MKDLEEFEQLLETLEKRFTNLKRLGEIMNEMKEISSHFQRIKEDKAFKDLIEIKELDEWAFAIIRNLQEIEQKQAVKISRVKESLQTKEYNFLNLENIKKAMKERGIEVVKDPEIELYFNNVIMMGINNLLAKTKARERARRIVDKAITQSKEKKRKAKSKRKKKK
ncbi:MAG: hypothetical protein ACTSRW_14275 [Candidatus Helarchaeota archaeon]